MIIWQVVVVSNQFASICILLYGLAQWVGYFELVALEWRNEVSSVYNPLLAFLVESEPVEEVLCSLLLFLRSVLRVIDEQVLRTATNKLAGYIHAFVVLWNRHHTHVLRWLILVEYRPIPVSTKHQSNLALGKLLLGYFALCRDSLVALSIVVVLENIEGVHQRSPASIGVNISAVVQ